MNKHRELTPDIPFGGARYSGMGTELGEDGLKAFTQRRILNIGEALMHVAGRARAACTVTEPRR